MMLEAVLLAMAQTQVVEPPTVDMTVASSLTSVAPGKTFFVTCTLSMPPGWHIYWTDPGDSGAPTEIEVTAPDGWQVGPVRYPTPERLSDPGGTVNAYEGSATFVVPVTPPADASPGSAARLSVEADWFVCRKVCFIGGATKPLLVAVSSKPGAPTEAAKAVAALPRPLADRPDTTVEFNGRSLLIGPIGPETRFIIESVPGVAVGTPQRTGKTSVLLEIPVLLEPDNSLGQPPRLRGLLIDGPGRYDLAWQVDLALPPKDDSKEDPKEDS